MCGIAGYRYSQVVAPSVLQNMVKALYHRGPDSEGYYQTSGYNAGMRRLSINDLVTGDQPLFNEDRSAVLLYNGEIYNYPQLRRELENKGHRFRTCSDGEVICHLYEEYEDALFEKIDGMFALALWIEPKQKLILARDIPGEKPLYYVKLSERELAFASEIKSLRLFPGIDLTLNHQALWDFPTFLWIPEPDTIYRGIKALLPGHLLVADDAGIRIRPYCNHNTVEHEMINGDKVAIAETRRVVEEAVVSRLLSDVPVGAFLSGGIDSSIVVTLAAKHLDQLSTFTIGFEDLDDPYTDKVDETPYAEAHAKKLGTRHHTIRATADTFLNDLERFCKYADQPFAVSSGLGILSVARAAQAAGIKVLLSGDGADECFGGYPWYVYLGGSELLHGLFFKDQSVSYQSFGIPLNERLERLNSYLPQYRAWAWHYYASESEKLKLYHPAISESAQSSLRYFYAFKENGNWTAEDFIKQDREFYFPHEMLRKVDRMTMAHSVEGRSPFASPAVLAHANRLRYSHMVKGNSLKWVLRKAFSDILPEELLNRPKHGFNVPIDHWLKNDWKYMVEETFSSDSHMMKMGLIHKKSRDVAIRMLNDQLRLNGHTIFSFIMLNLWLEYAHVGNHC